MAEYATNFRPILKPGRWELQPVAMKESVAMEMGAALYTDKAGESTIVTGAETNFMGILAEPIAATDADYAVAKKLKSVWVPLCANATAEFTVGAGTFTTADVGKSVAYNDSKSLAVDTAGDEARITKYLSSTRGECVFKLLIEA